MAQAQDAAQVAGVFVAIGLTGLICYLTLRLGEPIQRRLGVTGIHVLGRVLGLVLAGMALRQIESKPQVGGRSLATSGACAALVGVLWCVTVVGLVVVKHLLQS